MKKHMLLLLFPVIQLTFSFSTPTAKSNNLNVSQLSGDYVLTEEILCSLSYSDYEDCFNRMLTLKNQNPDCSAEELDSFAIDYYVEAYNTNQSNKNTGNRGFYDYLISWSGISAEELALAQ